MEAVVFIILQIFFATRAVLKIREYLRIRLFALDFYEVIVDDSRILTEIYANNGLK